VQVAKAPALAPAERRALGRDLTRLLAPYLGERASLCVIDSSGAPAFALNAATAVTPASVQKLIVASAAFRYLGAGYRFHTQLAAQNSIQGSALEGDLWLIGSGDPVLVSNDLRGGVKILAARGLNRIDGGVIVDAGAIAGPERNPFWDPADANYGFSSATSGVSLDQDTIEFHVRPGVAGGPALVTLEPPNPVVTFVGNVSTVSNGSATEITINPTGRENQFEVRGQIAAGSREAIYYLPVTHIAHYVGNVLESMLEARRIATSRPSRSGVAPKGLTLLWDHRSPPLRFVVAKMLFESNNHIAEQLLRTVGRAIDGIGDDPHGTAVETVYLRSENVPAPGLHLVDGSGLAQANRVASLTLCSLLSRSELTPGGNPLYLALPRGGIEGTLRHFSFNQAFGRVRAKSGHLANVSALAGYVTTHRHGRLAFAFLLDTSASRWDADAAIARAVDRLAEF
jgi:D-alanyl-D-alanine carboxypeptidase/D-alanyl-D-alanine-endopeptidase (penicillin-binding protein 4)